MTPQVKAVFDAMPDDVRTGALALRALIFDVAAELGIDPPSEELRWGQPSYHGAQGSPLRIGVPKAKPDHGQFAVYAHCQTSLIHEFANGHGAAFHIEGNRAVHFHSVDDIDPDKLRHLIRHALTYKTKGK